MCWTPSATACPSAAPVTSVVVLTRMFGEANSSWISRPRSMSLQAATTPVGRPCITCVGGCSEHADQDERVRERSERVTRTHTHTHTHKETGSQAKCASC